MLNSPEFGICGTSSIEVSAPDCKVRNLADSQTIGVVEGNTALVTRLLARVALFALCLIHLAGELCLAPLINDSP